MAAILDGAVYLKDFSSLTYKNNAINQASIRSFAPILQRKPPSNLEELVLIDCKLGGTVLENLLELLHDAKQLKKFSLIKPMHSERSFDKLTEFVKNS